MNNPKTHLGPEPHTDPNPEFDDGLYDAFKYDFHLPWSDVRVIWAVENGAQGPMRNVEA